MALFLLKPILWNTERYERPSGVRAAADSYPGRFGFGHEEWNNSPRMAFSEGGQRFRAFHTEGIRKAPVDEHAGQTFVMMTVSHDGVQQLVGVAGNAMYLGQEAEKAERTRIAKLLDLDDLWRDIWLLPSVRRRFADSATAFRRHFQRDVGWVPNWICPADFFFWLGEPVTLDPKRITGRDALPKMFTAYKALERDAASLVMNSVPSAQRTPTWGRVLDAMLSTPQDAVSPPSGADHGRATTRLAIGNARLGQGQFREALMVKWSGGCAVTGLTCPELLRASHVKPWSISSGRERLDPHNGLLLAAHLDALFDKGLISFDDEGKMLLSSRLRPEERSHFGLPRQLRQPPDAVLRSYLSHHREELFDRPMGP
ncbi:MAG TPA: HNH endonuclease [Albitalea sp.]|uniref:HNH endonuclease n=1 Tax=Piscinibacter sp. TaxID=1903157 RepID=UPI002ED00983